MAIFVPLVLVAAAVPAAVADMSFDISPDGSVSASFAAMEIVTLRVSWQARV